MLFLNTKTVNIFKHKTNINSSGFAYYILQKGSLLHRNIAVEFDTRFHHKNHWILHQ